MTKEIGIAFFGCGQHAYQGHIKPMEDKPGVKILRVFDPKIEASYYHLIKSPPLISSVEEILLDENVHAVFICSPDKEHAKQLLECVKHGKHVFCEKPIVINLDDINFFTQALDIAKKNGLIVSSCHPRHFDPPFVWLKERLSDPDLVEENFGRITDFNFNFWYHEVTDPWKKKRSLLLDHFGHELHLYRFLFSPEHYQFSVTFVADNYDYYEVVGTGKEGMPNFRFTGYRSLPEKVYDETITIMGTKNALVIKTNKGEGIWLGAGDNFKIPKMDYDVRFDAVNQDFIDAIREGTPVYLSHRDMEINNISGVELITGGSYN